MRELRDQGVGGSEIAKRLGISRASIYRVLEGAWPNRVMRHP